MVFCLTEVISYVNILHNREAMDLRRRKQRGILMDHGSILCRKRRGIEHNEIKDGKKAFRSLHYMFVPP